MSELDEMLDRARAVRERAHAPYSEFKVGACLRSDDGRLFTGCNVENQSYPLGQCAEGNAIAAMVAAGAAGISEILVFAEGESLCTPCGGCRQRIAEFADAEVRVHVAGSEGLRASYSLGELLPDAFSYKQNA